MDQAILQAVLADLERTSGAATREFEGVGDFLWKAPSFVEDQIKIELEKLEDYFPTKGDADTDKLSLDLRKARWSLESQNLFGTFPHMLSSGNLAATLSLMETYLLQICVILEPLSSKRIMKFSGAGANRLYKFLNSVACEYALALDLDNVDFHRELACSSKLRNALIHASGILQMCTNADEVRSIIQDRLYLREEHRQQLGTKFEHQYIAQIVPGNYGEQIIIGPLLPWRCSYYCREFIADPCCRFINEFSRESLSPRM